ncbi:MAG: hypothetical protein CMF49_04640 [Legionellales bacterium]|nr:hypothetical protein [Legionellales bacterium]|tara:strand:+ start:642 stop:1217 length:576 start_codon:yes stop_codon:yes gene_type:complete
MLITDSQLRDLTIIELLTSINKLQTDIKKVCELITEDRWDGTETAKQISQYVSSISDHIKAITTDLNQPPQNDDDHKVNNHLLNVIHCAKQYNQLHKAMQGQLTAFSRFTYRFFFYFNAEVENIPAKQQMAKLKTFIKTFKQYCKLIMIDITTDPTGKITTNLDQLLANYQQQPSMQQTDEQKQASNHRAI